jgi:hypothetical protein
MAIFDGFNIGTAAPNTRQAASSLVNDISNRLGSAGSNLLNSAGAYVNSRDIPANLQKAKGAYQAGDAVFNGGSPDNFASRNRMIQNGLQNVTHGAPPPNTQNQAVQARLIEDVRGTGSSGKVDFDWRVSLTVPGEISDSPVLAPLVGQTDGRMIFPFNPVIYFQQSANYAQIQPTHSNYPFHAYQGSVVNDITITGEFYVEDEADAAYWIGCVHFLRTMTKMFYGNGELVGNPPMMTRLNGYGKHVLNDIPCVISNFTVDLPSDIDYISVIIEGTPNYVPTQSTVTVTVSPNYARASVSKFSLKDFANGSFVGGAEGFV